MKHYHFKRLNTILKDSLKHSNKKTISEANESLNFLHNSIKNGIFIEENDAKILYFCYLLGTHPINYRLYSLEFLIFLCQLEKKPKINLLLMNDLFVEYKNKHKKIPSIEEFRIYCSNYLKECNI